MNNNLLYKILDCVDEVNTISELASKIYISQPYVSQILSKAEKKYHVLLINRKETPISLTIAGKKLRNGLRQVLDDQFKIKQILLPYTQNNKNYIKIAITPLWRKESNALIFKQLMTAFPSVQFEIHNIFTSFDSKRALENHTIDIFWGANLHGKDLKSILLSRPEAYLLLPANMLELKGFSNHLIINTDILDQINGLPMVSLTDDSAFQHIVDHLFSDYGVKPYKVIKINDFIAASDLVNKGLGFTVTLFDTLKYVDLSHTKIFLIPNRLIKLTDAITINNESSPQVQEVANRLVSLIKDIDESE